MATQADVLTFEQTWAPYAVDVGKRLGVNPATILSQWALESGYGVGNSLGFNVGSIKDPQTGTWARYGSPAEFADAYAGLIQRVYPGAVGTADNASSFFNALAHGGAAGNLSYFGGESPAAYGDKVAGASYVLANADPEGFAQVAQAGGGPTWWNNPLGAAGAALGRAAGGVAGAAGEALKPLAVNVGFVAFGFVLVAAVVAIGVMGGPAPALRAVTKG